MFDEKKRNIPPSPTPEEIANAGPDTLRNLLSVEKMQKEKLQELLKFARDAVKSAMGNLIVVDERLKDWDDLVTPYKKK